MCVVLLFEYSNTLGKNIINIPKKDSICLILINNKERIMILILSVVYTCLLAIVFCKYIELIMKILGIHEINARNY